MISQRYHAKQELANIAGKVARLMSDVRVPLLIRIRASLKAKLTELARREHRSVNQQIEFLLESSVQERTTVQKDDQGSKGTSKRSPD